MLHYQKSMGITVKTIDTLIKVKIFFKFSKFFFFLEKLEKIKALEKEISDLRDRPVIFNKFTINFL